MGAKLVINNRYSIGGRQYPAKLTVEGDSLVTKEKSGDDAIPAAKVGQLTTRTDNDTGVITMVAGHGFATSDRLDVYWDGGSRRGMAATVAVNAVTVDGGYGDNLPTNLTAVTVGKAQEEELLFTGDNALAIVMFGAALGSISICDAAGLELYGREVGAASQGEQSFEWHEGNGTTNPIAGEDVAKVFFSHSDSGGAKEMRLAILGT